MALRCKVVDLRRPNLTNEAGQAVAVGHVAMMQEEGLMHVVDVAVEMLDPLRAERARPTHETVHLVAFVQQQVGQIGTVLAGDAGNQCASGT